MCALRRAFQAPTLPALVLKIMRGNFQPIPEHYSKLLKGKYFLVGNNLFSTFGILMSEKSKNQKKNHETIFQTSDCSQIC